MKRAKVSVIGAGQVGGIVAFQIAQKELADIVLVDIVEGMPQGKALDISQSAGIEHFDARVSGTNNYADIKESDIVVITAGVARKPGMTREDLLKINSEIVKKASEAVKAYAPNAFVISVTNPLDIMTQLVYKTTGFKKNKVLGMAGVLDSARFALFIAEELGVSVKDIFPMLLGSHGDTMVPLPRYTTVSGIPLTELLPADKISSIAERARNGGAEIVALLKTGSAYFAPGSSAVAMVESILKDQKRILPCSVYLDGEYGIKGVFIGVPVKLGKDGVEQIIEMKLTAEETAALKRSSEAVAKGVKELGI
ncbi:MAG: malate dehydrogenase [Candidatus Firestonebacteria bacterium]